ncbi:glycosyltransferase [Actinocrispum wychmicini]|uniref:Glucosyl-3-phosphoglycerate synthase n=1 Tax=Actinocrispum wychmicini TaxID=1213861 RepID=A0A4R2JUD0_9PSEU|nr:glycosyltransferase [Actinocrispum wychmicini]TCO60876.1 glycosyl transferase family 2 [Actinocrispum wychmicini]
MVGVPARNEATTIESVARAADAGLKDLGTAHNSMIVLADNGSTDGTPTRFLEAATRTRQLVIQSGGTGTGKGTNVLALMRAALEHGAAHLILLDADVRSGEAAWIARLGSAVDGDTPTLAVPTYRRNRYEANTTNHLASPLVAALFGAPLQQPIGGEFAMNRALLEQARHWPAPASASLYGIDIWLTTNALREGHRVVEVPLGVKLHNSPFPKILSLPQQVLDALFHVTLRLDRPRPAEMDMRMSRRSAVDTEARKQDPATVAKVVKAAAGYLATHHAVVSSMFPTVAGLRVAPWGHRILTQDWPHILADGVEALARGQFQPARDHLIALYINRVLSFWDEIADLTGAEIDALLDRQATETVKAVADRPITFTGVTQATGFDRGTWTAIS